MGSFNVAVIYVYIKGSGAKEQGQRSEPSRTNVGAGREADRQAERGRGCEPGRAPRVLAPGPTQTHAASEQVEAACFCSLTRCVSCKVYLVGASKFSIAGEEPQGMTTWGRGGAWLQEAPWQSPAAGPCDLRGTDSGGRNCLWINLPVPRAHFALVF